MAHPTVPTLAAHGAEIPVIGFGTGMLTGSVGEIVAAALRAGYRHLDAARKYGTEEGVGEGIRAAGLPREELFITTKVSHENLRTADFARSVDTSLKALGVDHVDLLLVHWPNPQIPLGDTMGALARAKRQGLARHVGVANFNIALLDAAIRLCPEPLVNLQVEYHPYLDQTKMLEACRRRGLIMTAYCPLGRGRLIDDPVIADKLGDLYLRSEVIRLTAYRGLTATEKYGQPGPEGSLTKWMWSETNQELAQFAADLLGADALTTGNRWAYELLRSRGNTIEGGTTEILKNIVAERVLGLPRLKAVTA